MSERARHLGLVAGFHLLALSLWALHLYVRILPATPTPIPDLNDAEAFWWGVWPITYAPEWAVATGTVLLVFTIASLWLLDRWLQPSQFLNRQRSATSAPSRASQSGESHHRLTITLLLSINLLLLLAFVAFPIAHTRWGDAHILSKAISWPDPASRLTHSWQAPLDVFLHSQVWLHWHETFGWQSATPVYRLLSPIAGLLYLLAASGLSRQRWLAPAWLTFGLLTTLGLIQLFFGYIENYSFAAACLLFYLWLGLGALDGKNSLGAAATLLAITHAFHPSTLVLAPSLLYLYFALFENRSFPCGIRLKNSGFQINRSIGWQLGLPTKQRNHSWLNHVYQICIPMMLVGGATILLMETGGHGFHTLLTTDRPGGGDGEWFVPFWETTTRWEHYTMFSWPHLRDFFNEQMLVAPIVLPGILLLGLGGIVERFAQLRQGVNDAQTGGVTASHSGSRVAPNRFLLIATLCCLLFTWVWNPDYGGQRDWDLFSLAALPPTLLFANLLKQQFTSPRQLVSVALPLLMVQFFHTVAWVYQNTLPWAWPK